jgi:pyrimidine deaminase RibD-like protein
MDTADILPHFDYLRRAIHLAHETDRLGNLLIGALIVLDGEIIARGMNAIWKPVLALTRHAEMEALRATLLPSCKEQLARAHWEGQLLPAESDLLYQRIQELEGFHSPGSASPDR